MLLVTDLAFPPFFPPSSHSTHSILTAFSLSQATYAATRLFASNLNAKLSQRFFNLILLEKCRDDIQANKNLNYHYYMGEQESTRIRVLLVMVVSHACFFVTRGTRRGASPSGPHDRTGHPPQPQPRMPTCPHAHMNEQP